MGKGLRKYTKGKGSRWKQGQSSSSNPSTHRHRDAAKAGFFAFNLPETRSNVSQPPLNSIASVPTIQGNFKESQKNDDFMDVQDSTESMKDGASWKSNLTSWTQCTNPVFEDIVEKFSHTSPIHREMVSILAAASELIRENGGVENNTEYFATFLAALPGVTEEQSKTAYIYLISLIANKVPVAVRQMKFKQIASEMMKCLPDTKFSNNGILLSSAIKTLTAVLSVIDTSVWGSKETQEMLDYLLHFISHEKPKVRKQAMRSFAYILKEKFWQDEDQQFVPICNRIVHVAILKLQDSVRSKNHQDLLRTLNFVFCIIRYLPSDCTKSLCETLLQLMSVGDVNVCHSAIECLVVLMTSKPKLSQLTYETNAQLVNALYDYQPNVSRGKMASEWAYLEAVTICNLTRLRPIDGFSHIPPFLKSLNKYWQSDSTELYGAAERAFIAALSSFGENNEETETILIGKEQTQSLQSISSILCGLLSFEYHKAWNNILSIINALVKCCNPCDQEIHNSLNPVLSDLYDIRMSPHSDTAKFDSCIGSFVISIGPAFVLDVLPIEISFSNEGLLVLNHTVLLSILETNVPKCKRDVVRMETFICRFRDLLEKIDSATAKLRIVKSSKVSDKQVEHLQAVESQLWSLFAGFAKKASDLNEKFVEVAPKIGTLLESRGDLLTALCNILRSALSNVRDMPEVEENVMRRFAKNFLPRLFSIYSSESLEANTLLNINETLRAYSPVIPNELRNRFILELISRYKICDNVDKIDTTFNPKLRVLDILIAIQHKASGTVPSELKEFMNNLLLTGRGVSIEKKSLRLLEEMLKNNQVTLEEIQNLLISIPSTEASCVAWLHIVQHLLIRLSVGESVIKPELISSILPKIILSHIEPSLKTRKAANACLVQLMLCCLRSGQNVNNCDVENERRVIERMVRVLLEYCKKEGCENNSIVRATMVAISGLLTSFRSYFKAFFMAEILSSVKNVLVEMQSFYEIKRRKSKNTDPECEKKSERNAKEMKYFEVVQSVVLLFNAVVIKIPCGEHVPVMLKILFDTLREDDREHFRRKIRELIIRMVRKYDYSVLLGMWPAKHRKHLVNLHKSESRKITKSKRVSNEKKEKRQVSKNKRIEEEAEKLLLGSDDEKESENCTVSDDEDVEGGAYIKEDKNKIVDFLDAKSMISQMR